MVFSSSRGGPARRRLAIVGLVVVLVVAALVVVALGVAHAPSVRARVRAWAVERLRTDAGVHARIESLDYNLVALRVSLGGITLAADPETPPFLTADRISLDLPWSVITGRIAIESLEIVRPTITIARDRDGGTNLPAAWTSAEPTAADPEARGPIDIGHLSIRDLGVGYGDQVADLSIEGRGLTLAMARAADAALAGRLSMNGAVTIRQGTRQTSVSGLDGGVRFDGSALIVDGLTLRAPEGQARLDGTIDLLAADPRADLTYSGSLDLERLTPWIGVDPAPTGSLALSGQITGPLGRLGATVEVAGERLGWSTLGNVSIALRATVSDTVATVESFRAALAGGEITADAALPLDADGPGRARLAWRGLDVGVLAGVAAGDLGVRLASVADGTATLDWTGRAFMSGRGGLDNRLRAAPSSLGALAVEGHTSLTLDDGAWRLTLDQRLGDVAVLDGEARGRLDTDDVAASTVDGHASVHVPLLDAALQTLQTAGFSEELTALQPLRAGVDVTTAFRGTLRSPTFEGTLEANGLRYREIGPGHALARFGGTTAQVTVDPLRVELGPNRVEARASIGLDSNTLAGEVTAGLPDIAWLAATVPPEWRPAGSAHVQARVSGTRDHPTVAATLTSDDVRIAGQTLRGVRASARLDDDVVVVEAFELVQDDGRLTAAGRYAVADGRYSFDATGRDLVIAPITRSAPSGATSAAAAATATTATTTAGESGVETIPIAARFDLEIGGSGTLQSPTARGHVQVSRLAWDRYELGAGRIDAVVDARGARFTAALPQLPATLEAQVDLDAPRSFVAQASILGATLQQLAGPAGPVGLTSPPFQPVIDPDAIVGTLSVRARAAGTLDEVAAASVDVELGLDDVAVNGAPVRLARPARLRYAGQQLAVDDFELHIGDATLSAMGRSGAPRGGGDELRATLTGSATDLLPLARLVPSLNDLDASGALDVQVSVAGGLEAPQIEAELSLDSATFTLGALPPVREVMFHASFADGLLDLRQLRAEWQGARVDGAGRVPVTVLGDRLPDTYRRTLPDLPAQASVTVRVASVTEDALAPFLGPDALAEVVGRVDLVASVETTSLEPDDVTADITLERAELELARVPIAQARPTRLRLEDGRLEVVEWAWAGAGNKINVGGSAVVSGESPQLAFTVRGILDLQVLGAFSRDVVTGGIVTLDVSVSGSADAPRLGGELSVLDGSIIVRDPRVAVTGLEGAIDLAGDRITLRDVAASANGGTARIEGAVEYSGFELTGGTLAITGRGLAFEFPEGLRTEVDTDLQLALSSLAPSLTGRITILRGAYRDPLSVTGQLLGAVQVLSAEPAEGAEPGLAARLSLGLSIVSAQDILIDNNYGRLEIGSNLRVAGTLERPVLAGRLTLQEGGEVLLGGRTYRVRRGTVDFTSATTIEPNFNLALETRVQRYDITMEITGTPETIEVALRTPGQSQADVISLLLTGRLADESTMAQTEIARGQLLMLLSGEILGFAGRAVGLDTVYVGRGLGGAASDFDLLGTNADPSTRLTIGKNLSRNVEVIFSQSLAESGDITWIAINRPRRNLEIRGMTQDDGSRSYEFRHDLEFGGRDSDLAAAADQGGRRTARVDSVSFTGRPGFEARELRDQVKLGTGDRFDFYRWQQDRERLERFYHARDFLEAHVAARRKEMPSPTSPDAAPRIALEYEIDRGPRTALLVEGYALPGDLIDAMERAWGQAVFDGFLLDDLEGMAMRQLVEDGYLQATVTGEVVPPGNDGMKQIVLRIAAGTRFDDRRISFSGQEHVSAAALEEVVQARGLETTAWLRPDELQSAVEGYYHALGYLSAAVTVNAPVFGGASATLPVHVAEGAPFEIASVEVSGAEAKSEPDVRLAFGIAAGARYLPSSLEPARRAVEVDYLRDGYNDVRVSVTTTVDRERSHVSVALQVDEGRQQIVSGVDVTGGRVTSGGIIDRALDLQSGKPANLTDLYRAQKRLYDTGVFRTADVELAPVEGAADGPVEPVRAVVTLQELPTYRFRYGFRVNDRIGPTEAGREVQPALVVDLLRRNLFGRAVSTGAAAQIERDRRLARGIVSLPQFFRLPVTTSVFLTKSRETVNRSTDTPYIDDVTEITAAQRFRPAARMAVTYGYSFSRSHVYEPDPNPLFPALDLRANVARFTSTFAWDTRDDPSNAQTGWFRASGLELGAPSLGSDQRFIRYFAQQYFFRSVGRGLVLGSAFRFGVGRDFDSGLLQLTNRFRTGGATSVRGFAEDGLGERDFLGDPTGGNGLLLLNQELRFPIAGWVRGVTFIDAGNVFQRAGDLSLRRLEAGTGVGLRIHSPFVLLRIDYGMPLTHREREPFGRWYFGIGHTF